MIVEHMIVNSGTRMKRVSKKGRHDNVLALCLAENVAQLSDCHSWMGRGIGAGGAVCI